MWGYSAGRRGVNPPHCEALRRYIVRGPYQLRAPPPRGGKVAGRDGPVNGPLHLMRGTVGWKAGVKPPNSRSL